MSPTMALPYRAANLLKQNFSCFHFIHRNGKVTAEVNYDSGYILGEVPCLELAYFTDDDDSTLPCTWDWFTYFCVLPPAVLNRRLF